MQRYRITKKAGETPEQTWVLLPDEASATMQAQELSHREKTIHVRVYRELVGSQGNEEERELVLDLPPKK